MTGCIARRVLGSPYLWLGDGQSAYVGEEGASDHHRDQPVLHGVLVDVDMRSGY